MTITLSNGEVYEVDRANYGMVKPNGAKTYVVDIHIEDPTTILKSLITGSFTITNLDTTNIILNMKKIISYNVLTDSKVVSYSLEEISETEQKIQEIDTIKTKVDENITANNDLMLAIAELYEMVMSGGVS